MDSNVLEKDISDLSKKELLDESFIPSIFNNYPDDEARQEVLTEVLAVAKREKVLTPLKKMIAKYNKSVILDKTGDAFVFMNLTGSKKEDTTIENYVQAILNTKELYDNILFNEFTNSFEHIMSDKSIKKWDDSDDAWLLNTIEKDYNIYDARKCNHALNLCRKKFGYNPMKKRIESIIWDGKSRIDKFLVDIMKCDDDEYSREVSRMIFYGGIARLYYPGCKFDYMPILVGEQGVCKSTIVNWLTMETGSFREITTIEGRDGSEILKYAWICEFSELLAMIRNRMVENIKGYIARQFDTYRSSYALHYSDVPRHCIFIGTTNNYNFLIDRTGNRRFLPIEVRAERGELYARETEVKAYIEQCWAEAKYLLDNDLIYLSISSKYFDLVTRHTENFLEEDPQEGLVREYLRNKALGDKVCVLEIYTKALNNIQKKCNRTDSITIGNYMRNMKNWKRGDTAWRFAEYGVQRFWEKVAEDDDFIGE